MLLAVTMDTLRIFLLLASVLLSCGQGAVGDVIACSCAGCYLLARNEVPPTKFPPYTKMCLKRDSSASLQITYKDLTRCLLACWKSKFDIQWSVFWEMQMTFLVHRICSCAEYLHCVQVLWHMDKENNLFVGGHKTANQLERTHGIIYSVEIFIIFLHVRRDFLVWLVIFFFPQADH